MAISGAVMTCFIGVCLAIHSFVATRLSTSRSVKIPVGVPAAVTITAVTLLLIHQIHRGLDR